MDMVRAERARREDWRHVLKRSGFHAVAMESMGEKRRGHRFEVFIATPLERDLRDVANLQSFRVLMQAAALRIGNFLNHAELGAMHGCL